MYFVSIRKLYTNGKIYNYSLRKLSKLIGCAPSTLSIHIKILQQNGLIYFRDGHLHCVGRTKMWNLYKSAFFAVKTSRNRKNQLTNIQFSLFKRQLHQQYKAYNAKKEIIKMHNSKFTDPKTVKHLLNKEQNFRDSNISLETSCGKDLMLSNRKIGLIFKRSQATGLKIQKEFNRLGLIKSHRNSVIVEKTQIGYRGFKEKYISNKYHYSDKTGLVFQSLPNKFTYPMH